MRKTVTLITGASGEIGHGLIESIAAEGVDRPGRGWHGFLRDDGGTAIIPRRRRSGRDVGPSWGTRDMAMSMRARILTRETTLGRSAFGSGLTGS